MESAVLVRVACFLLFTRLVAVGADNSYGAPISSPVPDSSSDRHGRPAGDTGGDRAPGTQTQSVQTDHAEAYLSQAPDGFFAVQADNAVLVGTQINVYGDNPRFIGHWDNASDSVKWHVKIDKPGTYDVVFNYSLTPDCVGSVVVLSAGGPQLIFTPPPTADWKDYQRKTAGQVTINSTGLLEIDLTAQQKPGEAVINVRSITFIPVIASAAPDHKAARTLLTLEQAQAYPTQVADGSLTLDVDRAVLVGTQINVYGDNPRFIGHWDDASDSVKWYAKVDRPGVFRVVFNYALSSSSEGSIVILSIAGQDKTFAPDVTGSWNDYQEKNAGRVRIDKVGMVECDLSATQKPGEAVLNLRSITLVPTNLSSTRPL